ncbi:hypothetical protein D4R71_05415 [bacterium]|nr:MAG: hypothetical protein D4R71_05415 [bacterium]
MSKINEIENKLKEIDQGSFQKLCDDYLYRSGFEHITPSGSVIGKNKTKSGIPDTFIELENKNYIIVEYTTQQKDVFNKFKDDLNKNLDENKIGVSLKKIEKVFIVYNSTMKLSEVEQLQIICLDKNIGFDKYDISRISFGLFYKFPILAKEYLGVEVDTSQIITLEEFIKESLNKPFSPDLTNKFLFRETEIESIYQSLAKHSIVVIKGKPGVGKTRVSIEACKKFIEKNQDYQLKFIVDKSRLIDNDLVTYFLNKDKKFIIFIDDANRQTSFGKILWLLTENIDTIKLLITVRDYAFDKIEKYIIDQTNDYRCITIEPFDNKQIQTILKELKITNPIWLERIWDLSKGNVRLAIMAAKARSKIDHISVLNNVEEIYNTFYQKISADLTEINYKVFGLISFFSIIDLRDNTFLNKIEAEFNISNAQFIESSIRLHELELIDMWEKELIKISDQVLQTYIFYKTFIFNEILNLSIIFEKFYAGTGNKEKIKDAIYSSLNAFDYKFVKEKISKHIDFKYKLIQEDKKEVLKFYDLFWLLKPTETLAFIQNEIQKIPCKKEEININVEPTNITDEYIDILRRFINSNKENFEISLEILFQYLEKNFSILPQFIQYIKEDISFKRYSYNQHYELQKNFIDFVLDRIENDFYKYIMLLISQHFTNIIYQDSWMINKRTFTWTHFSLILTDEIKEIRKKIWNFIFSQYIAKFEFKKINRIFENYFNHIKFIELIEQKKKIIKFDTELLLPFINEYFDEKDLETCLTIHDYIKTLKQENLFSDKYKALKGKFINNNIKLYNLLTIEHLTKISYEDSARLHKSKLIKYFKNYSFKDYKAFIKKYSELIKLESGHIALQIEQSLYQVLEYIFEKDFKLFWQLINYLIDNNNKPNIKSYFFMKKLLEKNYMNSNKIYKSINKKSYNLKEEWILDFFQSLSLKDINDFYNIELLKFINEYKKDYLELKFDFLEKYKSFDENIYIKFIKILYNKIENKKTKVNFHLLFNPYFETSKKIKTIFKGNVELLKKIYFYQNTLNPHFDYDSKVLKQILEFDENFIHEYLEWLHKKGKYLSDLNNYNRYDIIWELNNSEEIITKIINYYMKNKVWLMKSHHHINVFFRLSIESKLRSKIYKFLHKFIKENAVDKEKINLIFIVITNNFPDERNRFLKLFIYYNSNVEDFKTLYLEQDSMSGFGTFVPTYLERIKFWESVSRIFTTADFLKHKLFAEQRIDDYRESIKNEERRNFSNDF